MKHTAYKSITQAILPRILPVLFFCQPGIPASAAGSVADLDTERFKLAWNAAGRGDHAGFEQIKQDLGSYVLYPYLQYEDYRNRRARVPVEEMSEFLDSHQDWAFAEGLRKSWLGALAEKGRWGDLVVHSEGVTDTVLRCQRARGKIILKQTEGVLSEAQSLWTVGESQPDECDPVFAWLIKNNGISQGLAWERIRLAMIAGDRHLVIYLGRFITVEQRRWLENWQKLSASGYSGLDQARRWPDSEITRMISAVSLQRLTRINADKATEIFQLLDGQFNWGQDRRSTLLRDIALFAAVELNANTPDYMARVPAGYRDTQLLEWWARFLLSQQDWAGLVTVIGQMPRDKRTDGRWRYWLAQAELRSGQTTLPTEKLDALSREANYYGFLAADELGLPYSICPLQPAIDSVEIDRLAKLEGFTRALELRKVKLDNWAVAEWSLATRHLTAAELKVAAALAHREDWHDRVIFALGNSGDLRFYEWRFPLLWETEIKRHSAVNQLDPAWVYGTIRSESAMAVSARSSANALGLMQLIPATGKRVARDHGLAWGGSTQLKTVAGNLPIGTAYMNELLQDHGQNPVLVSGAYNAGPNAVKRWLDNRPGGEAAIWVETLPYFETRDYIPRVLAFTTIYDWRMGGPVKRISTRMPHIESGKIRVTGAAEVVCREIE